MDDTFLFKIEINDPDTNVNAASEFSNFNKIKQLILKLFSPQIRFHSNIVSTIFADKSKSSDTLATKISRSHIES